MSALGIATGREELVESYPWLNECGDRRLPRDIQAKCKLSEALSNLGIDRLFGARLVEQASELPNFDYLNPKLLGFVIYLITRGISLNITTNEIIYEDDEGNRMKYPGFFENDEYFNRETGKITKLYKLHSKDVSKIKQYKMSVYRYLRLWFLNN